ncbi:MAG: hypothetical protein HGA38_01905 [Candidatus Moranbacteria bacterium]|nr:hypothetical protein [Candidatus Moranbacteria bacterium]
MPARFHGNSKTRISLIIGLSDPIDEGDRQNQKKSILKKNFSGESDRLGYFDVNNRDIALVVAMDSCGSFCVAGPCGVSMYSYDNGILYVNAVDEQEVSLIG